MGGRIQLRNGRMGQVRGAAEAHARALCIDFGMRDEVVSRPGDRAASASHVPFARGARRERLDPRLGGAAAHTEANPSREAQVLVSSTMAGARNASAAVRRLMIEYKQLTSDPNTLFPAVGPISEDNYLEWEALLPGPDDTPFEGGVFSARLSFRTLL